MWRVKVVFVSCIFFVLSTKVLFSQKKPVFQQPAVTKTLVEPLKKVNVEDSAAELKIKKKDTTKPEDELEALLKEELEGGNETPGLQKRKGEVSWGWQIIKTVLVLLFLIGAFGLFWKFYSFKKQLPSKESKVMQTLYRYNLSTDQQIQIVQLSQNLLVLGVSGSGINLISEITDTNKINQIKIDCEKENFEEKPDFLWELTKTMKEKFSNWSFPQKHILGDTAAMNSQTWSELRRSSKNKIQNLKEQKKKLVEDGNKGDAF